MINKINGDILTAKGYILHGVNCQGVMGSGVALAIRKKWPEVYDHYSSLVTRHGRGEGLLGTIQIVKTSDPDVRVVNCFTQDKFGKDGRVYASYQAILRCVKSFSRNIDPSFSSVVNFPKIGCGLGGLNWNVVETIFDLRIPDTFEKNLYVL